MEWTEVKLRRSDDVWKRRQWRIFLRRASLILRTCCDMKRHHFCWRLYIVNRYDHYMCSFLQPHSQYFSIGKYLLACSVLLLSMHANLANSIGNLCVWSSHYERVHPERSVLEGPSPRENGWRAFRTQYLFSWDVMMPKAGALRIVGL